MVRTILASSVLALVVVAAGCRMCAHPYDYCNPLYTGKNGPVPCASNARAGSVFSPGLDLPDAGPFYEEDLAPPEGTIVPEGEMSPEGNGALSGRLIPIPEKTMAPRRLVRRRATPPVSYRVRRPGRY